MSFRISIGRNILDGKLQVVKDELVHLGRFRLRYILIGRRSEQGHAVELAYYIEVQESTDGAALSHILVAQAAGFIPLNAIFARNQLVATVNAAVITAPAGTRRRRIF